MNSRNKPQYTSISFGLKIFLAFVAILLPFSISFSFLSNENSRLLVREQMNHEGHALASLLAASLQLDLCFEDTESMAQLIRPYYDLATVQAILVYGSDDSPIFRMSKKLHDSGVAEAAFFSSLSETHRLQKKNPQLEAEPVQNLFVFSAPVIASQPEKPAGEENEYFSSFGNSQLPKVLGHVQIVLVRKPAFRQAEEFFNQTLILAGSILFLVLFASFFLARSALKPFGDFAATIWERSGHVAAPGIKPKKSSGFIIGQIDQSFSAIEQEKERLSESLRECSQELQEAKTLLVQSEKKASLGRLVAGISLEIGNNTNFISGALPSLHKRINELGELVSVPDKGADFDQRCVQALKSIRLLLENVAEGARRTTRIVTDLKGFSKPGDEEMTLVDINQCLTSTLSLALPDYKGRIEINQDLGKNLPMVECALAQINQAFMNILLNGVHAQPGKGSILIRTWEEEDGVHVLFKDNGPGIPNYELARIFDPFFTSRAAGRGAGLGLSLSFEIVRRHKGEILARSAIGQGAEFEVILPVRQGN